MNTFKQVVMFMVVAFFLFVIPNSVVFAQHEDSNVETDLQIQEAEVVSDEGNDETSVSEVIEEEFDYDTLEKCETNVSSNGGENLEESNSEEPNSEEPNSEDPNSGEPGQEEPEQEEIIDVVVPAIWVPVDKDTNEVLDYLTPIPTIPDMYPRSEVAKLNADGYYEIDYMGVPKPGPGAWSANPFMYTANLFFRDQFHRVVAQGRDERNFDESISAVRKLVYGDFIAEAIVDGNTGKYLGLHGMTKTPYQEGEIMWLYIATETEDTSLSEAIFGEDILNVTYNKDDSKFRDDLYKNIKEVKFNDFDNWAQITTIDGESDQVGLKERLDTIYLYKYNPDGTSGEFIKDSEGYKNFTTNSFDSLAKGKYEVVFPIYWNRNVPDYMSAPDVFSRNRYQYDDTIHYTVNIGFPVIPVVPKTEVTGKKIWNGGPEEKPVIELQLYRDNLEYGNPVILENGQLEYTWRYLNIRNSAGQVYRYTVDEVTTPEDYKKTRSEDGLTITNTYVSPLIDITGRKIWMGGPEAKPIIELQLFRNDESFGQSVTLVDGETEYTWKDLDLNDQNAEMYLYRIDEVETLENYDKTLSEDGLTIINTYNGPVEPDEDPDDPDQGGGETPDPDEEKDPNTPGEDPDNSGDGGKASDPAKDPQNAKYESKTTKVDQLWRGASSDNPKTGNAPTHMNTLVGLSLLLLTGLGISNKKMKRRVIKK